MDIVQQTCDSLVYKYLFKKGHFKKAELLKEERKYSYARLITYWTRVEVRNCRRTLFT